MARKRRLDRSFVVFLAQIIAALLIVTTALIKLAIGVEPEHERLWFVLLSTGIAVLVPSPLTLSLANGNGRQNSHPLRLEESERSSPA